MSRYRITPDEYPASYLNHSPIYLCDSCDRIGVSIHQSSVCHSVHQLILKQTNQLHHPTEVGLLKCFPLRCVLSYPLLGRPAADHGIAAGGSAQCEPQLIVVACGVLLPEFVGHVHTSAEILAGL